MNNIENNLKEKEALVMFDNLKKHIGESVTLKAFLGGGLYEEQGILKEMIYFKGVHVGSSIVGFVGYDVAITSITLDETGEVLYKNPYIEKSCDLRNLENCLSAKRMIFGDNVINKQVARKINKDEATKKLEEQADLKAKKNKYKLLKEGIKLVRTETVDEWMEKVNSVSDAFSETIIKATILMMKKLEDGISFEEAANEIFGELELTYIMAQMVVNNLLHFSKNIKECEKYLKR